MLYAAPTGLCGSLLPSPGYSPWLNRFQVARRSLFILNPLIGLGASAVPQAVQLGRRGLDEEADSILRSLGCRFRLAPAALQSSRSEGADLRGAPVRTLTDPLPGDHRSLAAPVIRRQYAAPDIVPLGRCRPPCERSLRTRPQLRIES